MNNKWISVETPPEVGEYVLVNVGSDTCLKGRLMNNGWTAIFLDGEKLAGTVRPVTHWQPLPPPPDHVPDTGKMVEEELSDEELKSKFAELLGRFNRIVSDTPCPEVACNIAKECAEIAQQHTNSKLEELEKWVDKEFDFWEDGNKQISVIKVKDKITSLKQ